MENEKEKLEANKKFEKTHSPLVVSENLANKNEEKGITLIALVITIIVLLILAAVSIAMLTGDNGILTKANTAKTTNDTAQVEEEMKLLLADWQLKKRSNSSADLGDFLNEKLENGELDKVTDNKDGSYTIERNGYEGTISDEDGLVEMAKKEPEPPVESLEPGKEATATKNDNYTDKNGDKVTIPEGFKVSDKKEEENYTEDIVKDGLVVIAPDDSEFVWVPVPYVVAESEAEAIKKEGDKIVGKAMAVKDPTDENYYRGILYNFSGTTSSVMTGCTTTNFTSNGYREPANLDTSYDNATNIQGWDTTMYQSEYKAMVESVEKYGGFYVGRYETSINGSNVASKGGKTPMTAETSSGNKWYGMYNKQKNYASNVEIPKSTKKLNDVVGSSMIWGSQYDAMLNWILTGTDKSKVTANSSLYQGNTGNPNDVMNKIYDIGNNLFEWTLEGRNANDRVRRGGVCTRTYSPSNRYGSDANLNSIFIYGGSRLTLYIK